MDLDLPSAKLKMFTGERARCFSPCGAKQPINKQREIEILMLCRAAIKGCGHSRTNTKQPCIKYTLSIDARVLFLTPWCEERIQ